MNLVFFLSQKGEWVGMAPQPRAENRSLNPTMAIPQALTCPQCLLHGEKQTLCPSTGPQGRADLKTSDSTLPPSALYPIPSRHHPSCGPSSLPSPDFKQPLSAPPVLGDSPMVPGPDAQVVSQRHTLLPRARAAARNTTPQAPV